MAEPLSGVNGEIIRWAREFYNMDIEEAAAAIGVAVERYNGWENGNGHPTYAKLRKISEVFHKPSAVFFFPTPPQLPSIKGDLRTLSVDVVSHFSKNVIVQFEKAKVYQISLRELYGNRDSIFMHKEFVIILERHWHFRLPLKKLGKAQKLSLKFTETNSTISEFMYSKNLSRTIAFLDCVSMTGNFQLL